LEVVLLLQELSDNPKQQMLGRVLDSKGVAIQGAVINVRGVTRGDRTRYGGNNDVDPIAVSDEQGHFVISGAAAFDSVGVDIEARGFAKSILQKLETGTTRHDLVLVEGVSVRGRVIAGDKPLPGIAVGIAGADRNAEIFVGDWTVATDPDGRFNFSNLPANTSYQLYGKIASLASYGSIPARVVKTQTDESILNVGDLKVEPGFRVEGRVILTDGSKIPKKTRLLLGRDDAWDSQQLDVDADGHFAQNGVPPGIISLSVRVSGYRLATRNASLDPFSPYHLEGALRAHKTNLIVELEPGTVRGGLSGDQQALKREPIRGAEPAEDFPDGIKISGVVLDAETGKPLEKFTVTEGRAPTYDPGMTFDRGMNWFTSRKNEFTNGNFVVSFVKQPQAPGVLIAAEGYTPQAIGPVSTGTNVVIRLAKGNGIEAVLLKPDGEPAAGLTVYLTDTLRSHVYVNENMLVRDRMDEGAKHTQSDATGKFSFPPQIDAFSVIVIDDAGFANVRVTDLIGKKEFRLQSWAKIQGKLMIGSRPAPNESIRLGAAHIPYEEHPRQFPALSFYLNTKTDENGHFEFPRVPPVAVELFHEPKVRDSRMGIIPISQNSKFILAPGETREVILGGKGRPVIGKFIVNGYDQKIDWRADVQSIELEIPEPADLPDYKKFAATFSEAFRSAASDEEKTALREKRKKEHDEQIEQTRRFYSSEAGRAYHFAKKRYALNFSQDGTFRVEDVPAGNYTMNIELREGGGDPVNRFSAPKIASFKKDFQVPNMEGARSDAPFDLGTINAGGIMKPGKAAPEFEAKTIENKPVKLSDFKGKYLLLDFWAVWCGPCVAETPDLKETFDSFKENKAFAMVGLSLDPDADAPRKYAAKNQLGWIQGFLGDWSKTDLPSRYGVEGIPSIFLIGPDGKIIASGLRGPAIKSAVEAALSRK
ncbi:MAG: polymerase sigma factor, sigma-70 family, partial [Verrucomicrobiales bacterium]|nr:polymerase sigma factor, sigma-70 family [Verrucomicrobiales bacterium]